MLTVVPWSHHLSLPLENEDKREREEGEEGEGKRGRDNKKMMGPWDHPLVPLVSTLVDLPPAPHGKTLWVYDLEVFPDHVLVVLSDGRTWREYTEFTFPDLAEFLNDPGLALAGFNNHAYDDLILRHLVAHPDCTAAEVYRLSNRIINPQEPEETDANFQLQYADKPWGYSIDVFQLLNGKGSLKEWACREGFERVAESPVDFQVPVPDDQIGAIRDYCRNDVLCTLRLLQQHWHLVTLRTTLAERFRLGWRVYCLSEPKLAQHTFLTLHQQRTRESVARVRSAAQAHPNNLAREFSLPQIISRRVAFTTPPFQALLDHLRRGLAIGDEKGTAWSLACPGLDLTKPLDLAGRQFQFGVGGLHSVDGPGIVVSTDSEALIDLDVTSYYPAIIITEGLHPQHLGPAFVADLAMLRDQRVAAKRAGDKAVADALKIVINSTFGKLNDAWSPLRSIPDALRVTINGQLFLLMLIEALQAAGAEIVSANTDGVTIRWQRNAVDQYLPGIIATWQQITAMELERTDFVRLCRRDVNSYIALTAAGTVKSKGAFNPESGKGDGAVIKRAVEAYLLHGTDPGATIDAESDITAFLFYQRVKNGGDLFHGDTRLGKTARWYATTTGPAIRRQNPTGTWATIPQGHQARLALDIAGWTRANLIDLDRAHYVAEAWKHIEEIIR